MPKVKLTTAFVEKHAPPKSGQVDYFDQTLPGFGLRISASGVRSFVCFYRVDGKLRRDTLGKHPKLTLGKARDKARAAFETVSEGRDPRAEKQERKSEIARQNSDTYAGAVEDFIAKYAIAKKGNRSHREQRRLLLKANEAWHDRPVASITVRDVHDVLDGIVDDGKGYAANRTYEALATFFRWLDRRNRVTSNTMAKIERPFDGEKPRERAWTDAELKAIWKAADELDGDEMVYVRLLLLMGQRKYEIGRMRWDELDLEASTWILPVGRAKAKRVHKFPMPSLAARMLKSLPRVKDHPFVFPGKGTRKGEPNAMTIGTKLQSKIQKFSGVADFTFHDARRTFRTGLDRLKVPPHIKEETLNHARRGVGDRHYSTYDYMSEQREAFDAWQDHIAKLVYPKGVVGLRG